MQNLSNTQLNVLSKAAASEGGVAVVPAYLNRAAATKVGASLIARKLMREVRSKPGMSVWRETPDGKRISLILTSAGRETIGAAEDKTPATKIRVHNRPRTVDAHESPHGRTGSLTKRAKASPAKAFGKASAMTDTEISSSTPAPGSKLEMVIGLMSNEAGATLEALVAATGWLPHSARAALTGLRKRGIAIERHRQADAATSAYRILSATTRAA